MKAKAIIERGSDGTYDINLEYREDLTFGLLGQGNTVQEAIEDFYRSRDDIKAYYHESGKTFPNDLEFEFVYDVPSFLESYSDKISLAGLGRLTGINRKQLSHYLNGTRNPSKKTVEKIQKSLQEFGKEISQVKFV